MSAFTSGHPQCDRCYIDRYPGIHPGPHRERMRVETCCGCGTRTQSGLYDSGDPDALRYCFCEDNT